jgi:16S rRNA (cytosine967-C5)-methyltransferase
VHPVQIAHERDDRIKRLAGKIDRVLVDAPCSGLGTLRRNPDLKWRQTPDAVEELQVKQAAILASAARLLKPGGPAGLRHLQPARRENEAIAEAFTEAQSGRVPAVGGHEVLAAAHVEGHRPLVRTDPT